MTYYVYILLCSDQSYYVGHTEDLEQRVAAHNAGKGAAFTKARRPAKLVYHELFRTKAEAVAREAQLKKWSKAKKSALIDGDFQCLHILAKRKS